MTVNHATVHRTTQSFSFQISWELRLKDPYPKICTEYKFIGSIPQFMELLRTAIRNNEIRQSSLKTDTKDLHGQFLSSRTRDGWCSLFCQRF